jgi:UDP-N-acetylglucosamine:LPS N-acetylglucosamine transferase/predicted metal-dependent phosphoesterase TrpH
MVKRVLILTAGFGDGHNAAARNLREALEQIAPEAEVTVADLYERSYKKLNAVAKKAYLGAVRYTPRLWAGLFKLMDHAPWLGDGRGLDRLHETLAGLIDSAQPDCVVSTYPAYGPLLLSMYRGHCERPFRFVTVITDARSVNALWYRGGADRYVVCDEATGQVLQEAGVAPEAIAPLGFPVSPQFCAHVPESPQRPRPGTPLRVLYCINTGQKKCGKVIDRLLEIPNVELTVTVGRHSELKEKLAKRAREYEGQLHVLGWTNQMPQLLLGSHVVVGKAGGASVQEAIAAKCPMIINQVIPGQEEGNADLIREGNIGVVVDGKKELAQWVERLAEDGGELWTQWRRQLEKVSRPDAALQIAKLILSECDEANRVKRPETLPAAVPADAPRPTVPSAVLSPSGLKGRPARHQSGPLLCDFHIHTNYSDGKLSVPEVVDFYGARGFDCICITDHWADTRRLIGKLARLTPLTLSPDQIEEYFEVLTREARRAWRRYGMLVLTGLEFNKDGPTKKSSAHLLGIDLQIPISPRLDLLETITRIHAQGGLAVAAHPHLMKSEWTKDTLYLWEHQEKFAPVIDAWEIANRNNLFTPVSLRRLPFLANSDFHKPKHIFSWKTLLHCEKDAEAIKDCIRRNEGVSITLYRGDEAASAPAELPPRDSEQPGLPLEVAARDSLPPARRQAALLPSPVGF